MTRYLSLFRLYFKLGLLGELEYRSNFYIQILESSLSLIVAVGGLAVVFSHTSALGAWNPTQLLALVGVHLTIGGILRFVIAPSLNRFTADVRSGKFDFVLIKPVNAQFLVSVQRVEIWKLVDIGLGLFVIGIAIWRLGSTATLGNVLMFVSMMLLGMLIVYSFWIVLATTSFWIIRTENIFQVFNALFVAGRWPVGIYPRAMRMILTFIVPIAFAVTIPAQGLAGTLTLNALLLAIGVAFGTFAFALWFWRFGIRFYAGASA